MKNISKLFVVLTSVFALTSCDFFTSNSYLEIVNGDEYTLEVGSTFQITINGLNLSESVSYYSEDSTIASVSDTGLVLGIANGSTYIYASSASLSDSILVNVVGGSDITNAEFNISLQSTSLEVNEYQTIIFDDYEGSYVNTDLLWVIEDEDVIFLEYYPYDNSLRVYAESEGITSFYLYNSDGNTSNSVEVEVINGINPYRSIDSDEFYDQYTRAESYQDAMYRSEYYLMSGDIVAPDQAPTISSYQPSVDGTLIHNSTTLFSNNNRTYTVLDAYGNFAFEIYYGAAYITLEEVAAYVYAWGEVPINYSDSKSTSQIKTSEWGEYLRLNNTAFSGDTSRYPYEPVLPDISGCGGNLQYYEIDIGTTGTDSDSSYSTAIYNDGSKITRGAARIVYSRYYEDTGEKVDMEDRYVFYTYNHYNDFQEYLNYENGWGEIFGNITGGGTLSSKTDYNPTDYIATIRQNFI